MISVNKHMYYINDYESLNLANPALTTLLVLLVVVVVSSSSSLTYVADAPVVPDAARAAAAPLAVEVACISSASGPGRCSYRRMFKVSS